MQTEKGFYPSSAMDEKCAQVWALISGGRQEEIATADLERAAELCHQNLSYVKRKQLGDLLLSRLESKDVAGIRPEEIAHELELLSNLGVINKQMSSLVAKWMDSHPATELTADQLVNLHQAMKFYKSRVKYREALSSEGAARIRDGLGKLDDSTARQAWLRLVGYYMPYFKISDPNLHQELSAKIAAYLQGIKPQQLATFTYGELLALAEPGGEGINKCLLVDRWLATGAGASATLDDVIQIVDMQGKQCGAGAVQQASGTLLLAKLTEQLEQGKIAELTATMQAQQNVLSSLPMDLRSSMMSLLSKASTKMDDRQAAFGLVVEGTKVLQVPSDGQLREALLNAVSDDPRGARPVAVIQIARLNQDPGLEEAVLKVLRQTAYFTQPAWTSDAERAAWMNSVIQLGSVLDRSSFDKLWNGAWAGMSAKGDLIASMDTSTLRDLLVVLNDPQRVTLLSEVVTLQDRGASASRSGLREVFDLIKTQREQSQQPERYDALEKTIVDRYRNTCLTQGRLAEATPEDLNSEIRSYSAYFTPEDKAQIQKELAATPASLNNQTPYQMIALIKALAPFDSAHANGLLLAWCQVNDRPFFIMQMPDVPWWYNKQKRVGELWQELSAAADYKTLLSVFSSGNRPNLLLARLLAAASQSNLDYQANLQSLAAQKANGSTDADVKALWLLAAACIEQGIQEHASPHAGREFVDDVCGMHTSASIKQYCLENYALMFYEYLGDEEYVHAAGLLAWIQTSLDAVVIGDRLSLWGQMLAEATKVHNNVQPHHNKVASEQWTNEINRRLAIAIEQNDGALIKRYQSILAKQDRYNKTTRQ
ncbi:MAG: hypothetical protein IT442_12525 [Phycisphaeraceae bacterium]|nr:hypothetical protein [Phycisphaeraceae bacterium]